MTQIIVMTVTMCLTFAFLAAAIIVTEAEPVKGAPSEAQSKSRMGW